MPDFHSLVILFICYKLMVLSVIRIGSNFFPWYSVIEFDCKWWIFSLRNWLKYEPAHDKTNKWHMHPAKTQISLGIRPVWSVFAVRMQKAWVLSYPLSAQQITWSDWADAQADLSLRWAHMPFCWFCHALARIVLTVSIRMEQNIGKAPITVKI